MGKAKKSPKFAVMKKIVTSKALKQYKEEVLNPKKKDLMSENLPRNVPYVSASLFFKYNTALGPPYRVLVDTNFINFSIQNKDVIACDVINPNHIVVEFNSIGGLESIKQELFQLVILSISDVVEE